MKNKKSVVPLVLYMNQYSSEALKATAPVTKKDPRYSNDINAGKYTYVQASGSKNGISWKIKSSETEDGVLIFVDDKVSRFLDETYHDKLDDAKQDINQAIDQYSQKNKNDFGEDQAMTAGTEVLKKQIDQKYYELKKTPSDKKLKKEIEDMEARLKAMLGAS